MTRSEFKSQASLFRARHPSKPEFDANGKLSLTESEECRGVMFYRGHGPATFYPKRDTHEVACRAAMTLLLCQGNVGAGTRRNRLALLKMVEFQGALPLPA